MGVGIRVGWVKLISQHDGENTPPEWPPPALGTRCAQGGLGDLGRDTGLSPGPGLAPMGDTRMGGWMCTADGGQGAAGPLGTRGTREGPWGQGPSKRVGLDGLGDSPAGHRGDTAKPFTSVRGTHISSSPVGTPQTRGTVNTGRGHQHCHLLSGPCHTARGSNRCRDAAGGGKLRQGQAGDTPGQGHAERPISRL